MSPIKILEYVASRVPIIACGVKKIKERYSIEERPLFNENDSLNLAETIEKLVNSENLRYSLVEKVHKTAKNYTYQKRCHEILDFFTTKNLQKIHLLKKD